MPIVSMMLLLTPSSSGVDRPMPWVVWWDTPIIVPPVRRRVMVGSPNRCLLSMGTSSLRVLLVSLGMARIVSPDSISSNGRKRSTVVMSDTARTPVTESPPTILF